jgi:hypothetical protein
MLNESLSDDMRRAVVDPRKDTGQTSPLAIARCFAYVMFGCCRSFHGVLVRIPIRRSLDHLPGLELH